MDFISMNEQGTIQTINNLKYCTAKGVLEYSKLVSLTRIIKPQECKFSDFCGTVFSTGNILLKLKMQTNTSWPN